MLSTLQQGVSHTTCRTTHLRQPMLTQCSQGKAYCRTPSSGAGASGHSEERAAPWQAPLLLIFDRLLRQESQAAGWGAEVAQVLQVQARQPLQVLQEAGQEVEQIVTTSTQRIAQIQEQGLKRASAHRSAQDKRFEVQQPHSEVLLMLYPR